MNHIETALQKTVGFGVKEFIKKATEGGWIRPECEVRWRERDFGVVCRHPLPCNKHNTVEMYSPFLDPLAWQAVAKVEGWTKWGTDDTVWFPVSDDCTEYKMLVRKNTIFWYMHRFIDNLFEQV